MKRTAWILGVLACGFFVLFSADSARAGSVYGTNIDLNEFTNDSDGNPLTFSGSRSAATSAELIATGDWEDVFQIDFVITDNQDGSFTYRYEVSGFPKKDVSHLTIDVSDNVLGSDIAFDKDLDTNSPGDKGAWPTELGDKDGITSAFKFDFGGGPGTWFQITIGRVPMWGDVYVKGGGVEAYNAGYGIHADGDTVLNYLPTPDSRDSFPPTELAPIPTSAWMGFSLFALVGFAYRIRRRRHLA